MSSYWEALRASSNCIHFIYDAEISDGNSILDAMRNAGVRPCYVDCGAAKTANEHLANAIARKLDLDHAPYAAPSSPHQPAQWVPFLDDLITLSESWTGLVIVVDRANLLLLDDSRVMFNLIEAFLTQVHHWLERRKPCHLCFQMSADDTVQRTFA